MLLGKIIKAKRAKELYELLGNIIKAKRAKELDAAR